MRTNDTLDPLVSALSVLTDIYCNAEITNDGDVIIKDKAFFKTILAEMGKLQRVLASSVNESAVIR